MTQRATGRAGLNDQPRPATISVVIPTALKRGSSGRPLIAHAIESLLAGDQSREHAPEALIEVIAVTQGQPLSDKAVDALSARGIAYKGLDDLGAFNFSRKVNRGVAISQGDVVLLLNDDVTVTTSGWGSVLLDLLRDTKVGAVGPVIWNPDGSLNSFGDATSRFGPRHVDAVDLVQRPELSLSSDRQTTLLTGAALAVRREAFDEVGGFDEAYPSSFGDVDFCLRLEGAGYRLVCTSRISAVHAESSTRDPRVDASDIERLMGAYPRAWADDPLLPPRALVRRAIAKIVQLGLPAYKSTLRRALPPAAREAIWRAMRGFGLLR